MWLSYPLSYGFTGFISFISYVPILTCLRLLLNICTILFIRSVTDIIFVFIAFKVYFKAYIYILKVKIFKVDKVVFKDKAAEYSWNNNNIGLLRDASLKAVVLEDLKLKIKVILFVRVFNFVYIELN